MIQKRDKILIADDIKSNINILIKVLKDQYDISYVQDGESVLKYVDSRFPDLILLDILMPGMDGYEVCENLKANEKTKNIPVIFITSKSKDEDEARGFELGAVDYITKPFSFPIVKARVKTHLALKNALIELESQNEELREAAVLREDIGRITRHDLKTPLVSIIGYSEMCLMDEDLMEEYRIHLETIKESGYKMLEMINLSLDLFKMERSTYQFKPAPVNLIVVIKKILSELYDPVQNKNISVITMLNGREIDNNDKLIVPSEELLCYSMFSNLIKTR